MSTRTLSSGWFFAQIGSQDWSTIDHIPTTVHVELLRQKKIPDPFFGLAEWDVQWVGEADWIFKASFDVTAAELADPNVDLLFDGLDTFCTIKLNNTKILKTDNQFVPEPFKYIVFPPVEKLGLTTKIGKDGESVTLSTKKPIKGIVLDVADRSGAEVKWNDQSIDLVPGDDQVVRA
ncbi:galactose-binding domain-like protein [Auriculariales sp. MPI-PUGE-AT-0066]|nr:galactose-binding domain-like protein [Auriculariales sp. MPI-PUGE-AT-0066]